MVRLEASMAAARLRLFVALALLLGACLLALAAPAGSAEDLGGLYVVVDGPKAGSFVEAKDDGTVNIGDNIRSGADGHLAAARGRCKSLHFRGEIDGVEAPADSCWRVVRYPRIGPLGDDLAEAIVFEDSSLFHLHHPKAKEDIKFAKHFLSRAFDEIDKKVRQGVIPAQKAGALKDAIEDANRLDGGAEEALRRDDSKTAHAKITEALRKKHQVFNALPLQAVLVLPPELKTMLADFDPSKSQTVYTARATDPDGRDLEFHWSLVEHNDPTCINFEPNTPRENKAIWHHGDDQGCNHAREGSNGHFGTIIAVITDRRFQCLEVYNGSNDGEGPEPGPCKAIGPGS